MITLGLPRSSLSFSLLILETSSAAKTEIIIKPTKAKLKPIDKIVRNLFFINFFLLLNIVVILA
jgi:hypothetical protein